MQFPVLMQIIQVLHSLQLVEKCEDYQKVYWNRWIRIFIFHMPMISIWHPSSQVDSLAGIYVIRGYAAL